VSSAPAELPTGASAGPPRPSLPIPFRSLPFELSADAPYRAIRNTPGQSIYQAAHPLIPAPSGESKDTLEHARDAALPTVAEELTNDSKEGLAGELGRSFRVDWIRTEHLPFYRTKHLRNPWNHGREVKISRDGTELEPSIGQQLLEEWDKRLPSPSDIPEASSRVARRRRGAHDPLHFSPSSRPLQ
jgi:hypothetical protein